MKGEQDRLVVLSGLPLERASWIEKCTLRLHLAGLATTAGIRDPIDIDAVRFTTAWSGKGIFKVSLSCKGLAASGMSVANWDEALTKAVGELCESIAWSSTPRTPFETRSGWACGSDAERAARSAYAELIERDSILTHLLCQEVQSTPTQAPKDCLLGGAFARLWSADPSVIVVLAGQRRDTDGTWFLGCGTGADLDQAAIKAGLELASMIAGYSNAELEKIHPDSRQFQAHTHVLASGGPEASMAIANVFSGGGGVLPSFKASQDESTVEVSHAFGRFGVVAKTTMPGLCPLQWGEAWQDSRQSVETQLKGRGLNPNWIVHPYA